MDFRNTTFSVRRDIRTYSKLKPLMAWIFRNRRFAINKNRIAGKEYLDIGCGPHIHSNFINLDYGYRPELDVCWDVTLGIPLATGTLKGIFTEHCFEHLPSTKIGFVLEECKRVLAPGGRLRIIVPDGELYLTRYPDLIRKLGGDPLPNDANDCLDGVRSPIIGVNRIFRDFGHTFIYDYDCLSKLLLEKGFSKVERKSVLQGDDSNLLIDTPSRAPESLYLEAEK